MRDDNNAVNGRPALSWVPVVDARGRTYLEARWTVATATATTAAPVTPAPVTAAHHAA